jgi:peptidoglycan/xylan/chitin deacetylase (PgdA/CDA1 family)
VIPAFKRAAALGLHRSGLVRALGRHRHDRVGIILMYHRVNDDADPFFPALDVASFEEQLDHVRATYQVDTLDGLARWLRDGPPGPPRAALTIDDGYADTHAVVLPRLRARGLPATLFLATAPSEEGRLLWLDRLRALLKLTPAPVLELPERGLGPWPLESAGDRLTALGRIAGRLKRAGRAEVEDVTGELWRRLDGDGIGSAPVPLSWEQVRELDAGGVEVGGHTHRHYVLSHLDRDEARQEIARSLDLVRERVGRVASGFACPNGTAADYTSETLDVLRELGVTWACTTSPGFATESSAPLELPRVYTSMDSLPLFACRLAGLTRLHEEPSGALAD